MNYYSIFFKNFKNLELNFQAFGRNIQIVGENLENVESLWGKFNRKIEFLTNFRNVVTKNRDFGNGNIFCKNFPIGGGRLDVPCVPFPGGAYSPPMV